MPEFRITYALIYITAALVYNSSINRKTYSKYLYWMEHRGREGEVWNSVQVNCSLLLNASCVLDNRIWYILLGTNHPGWARACIGHPLSHNQICFYQKLPIHFNSR